MTGIIIYIIYYNTLMLVLNTILQDLEPLLKTIEDEYWYSGYSWLAT